MDPRQNQYTRRIQHEGMVAVGKYLKAIFTELDEIKKAMQKTPVKKEEVKEEKK